YSESEEYFLRSIDLADKQGDLIHKSFAYYNLAKIAFVNEKYPVSLEYLDNADNLAKQTDALEWQIEINNLYAKLYEKTGQFKKAYEYKDLYSTLRDSLFNEELIKNLANIQLDFQEEQTQEIIASKDFQIERRDQINLLLGGITLLITALLFILYKNIQLKKKANKRLAEANNIIEEQNKELTNVNAVLEERVKERTKELKEANVALRRSNEELDNFIYKTSHDIRGPLATLMGVCNIAQIDVKDEQALDYFNKLSITANRLNEILSKLLIINQINNTAMQKEEIDFSELIHELVEEQKENFDHPEVDIDIDIGTDTTIKSDEQLMRVICSNLISNAIKFRDTSGRKDSFVRINLSRSNGNMVIKVVDNGLGINQSESEKIFEVFSKATDIIDSSGIGLYLVKLSVEKLKGSIQHGETETGDTLFEVKLPVE
ncbi:MAG: HAMP domain-containing sensor histidine kinase, partial [Fulvivirga sp.]|nr:HAMP domain-containing sensor histidine kinase [Fulvivirga sp.]